MMISVRQTGNYGISVMEIRTEGAFGEFPYYMQMSTCPYSGMAIIEFVHVKENVGSR